MLFCSHVEKSCLCLSSHCLSKHDFPSSWSTYGMPSHGRCSPKNISGTFSGRIILSFSTCVASSRLAISSHLIFASLINISFSVILDSSSLGTSNLLLIGLVILFCLGCSSSDGRSVFLWMISGVGSSTCFGHLRGQAVILLYRIVRQNCEQLEGHSVVKLLIYQLWIPVLICRLSFLHHHF